MNHLLKAVRFLAFSILACCILVGATAQSPKDSDDMGGDLPTGFKAAQSVGEARGRAKLLHETIRGTLQVMHRDFFDEDDARAIPSSSLEDVFKELSLGFDVDVKWLVVNTDIVNVDHRPADRFEKEAAKALAKGKNSFETTESADDGTTNRYRYAGQIHLRSQCLKCHVKRRTSNDDRVAGLVISMPLAN